MLIVGTHSSAKHICQQSGMVEQKKLSTSLQFQVKYIHKIIILRISPDPLQVSTSGAPLQAS